MCASRIAERVAMRRVTHSAACAPRRRSLRVSTGCAGSGEREFPLAGTPTVRRDFSRRGRRDRSELPPAPETAARATRPAPTGMRTGRAARRPPRTEAPRRGGPDREHTRSASSSKRTPRHSAPSRKPACAHSRSGACVRSFANTLRTTLASAGPERANRTSITAPFAQPSFPEAQASFRPGVVAWIVRRTEALSRVPAGRRSGRGVCRRMSPGSLLER